MSGSNSEKERVTKRLFKFLAKNNVDFGLLEKNAPKGSHCVFFHLAIATGVLSEICQRFIAEEVQIFSEVVKSSMSNAATSLTNSSPPYNHMLLECIRHYTNSYFDCVLSPSISKVVAADSDRVFDLNPEKNGNVWELVKKVLETVVSHKGVQRMPLGLRLLFGAYHQEMLKVFSGRKEDVHSGLGAILCRWVLSPGLENAGNYSLVYPHRKSPPTTAAKTNLHLLNQAILHLSTRTPFSPSDPLHLFGDELAAHCWRFSWFFEEILRHVKTDPLLIDPTAATPQDYSLVYSVIAANSIPLRKSLPNEELRDEFDSMLTNCFSLNDLDPDSPSQGSFLPIPLSPRGSIHQVPPQHTGPVNVANLDPSSIVNIRVVTEIGGTIFERTVSSPVKEGLSTLKNMNDKLDRLEKKHPPLNNPEKPQPSSSLGSSSKGCREGCCIISSVFGIELRTLVLSQRCPDSPDILIPFFVRDLVEILLDKGLREEGIFRISAAKGEIENLKAILNQYVSEKSHCHDSKASTCCSAFIYYSNVNYADFSNHAIANVLKSFLRELPTPLIPGYLLEDFLDTAKKGAPLESRTKRIRHLISLLPRINRAVLALIMKLGYFIQLNAAVNRMTSTNLGVVFGPNLLVLNEKDCTDVFTSSDAVMDTTKFMIDNYLHVFIEEIEEEKQRSQLAFLSRRVFIHERSVHILRLIPFQNSFRACTSSGTIVKFWDLSTLEALQELDFKQYVLDVIPVEERGELWIGTERAIQVVDLRSYSQKSPLPNIGGISSFTRVVESIFQVNEIWVVGLDTNSIFAIDMNGTSRTVGTGRFDSCVFVGKKQIWSTKSISHNMVVFDCLGNVVSELPAVHQKKVTAFVRTSDTQVWSSGEDNFLCCFDSEKFVVLKKIEAHWGAIKGLSFHNNLLWTFSWDTTIKAWDLEKGIPVDDFTGHSDAVSGIIFFQDPKNRRQYAWTSSYDRSICVWQIQQRKSSWKSTKPTDSRKRQGSFGSQMRGAVRPV